MTKKQEDKWCCCHQQSLKQQQMQEKEVSRHLQHGFVSQSKMARLGQIKEYRSSPKQIFSFRTSECRLVSPPKYNFSSHPAIIDIQKFNKTKCSTHPSSYALKEQNRNEIARNRNQIQQKLHINFNKSSRLPNIQKNTKRITPLLSPRIKIIFSSPEAAGKMQGKRIKTVEEETEYSSKHSQVHFKSINDYTQAAASSFHNIVGKKKYIQFQDDVESYRSQKQLNCSSLKEVPAHEEADNSISNQFLQNARTIQTIVTSTEFRSREPSNTFNFLKSPNKSSKVPSFSRSEDTGGFPDYNYFEQNLELESIEHLPQSRVAENEQNEYFHQCPSFLQKKTFSPQAQSNMFYSDQTFKKKFKSPKISVLHIEQRNASEEEELRDVINSGYLESPYYNKVNSPFISIDSSLKTLMFQKTPDHSRQVSSQLYPTLFKQTLEQLRKTNTIQSLDSSISEVSCVDMKFIQKNRMRRQVSKLV